MSAWPGWTGSECSRTNRTETMVSGNQNRAHSSEHDPRARLPALASARVSGCAAELVRTESSRSASNCRATPWPSMMETREHSIREYVDTQGRSPYRKWFKRLDSRAAAKVATALYRMEQGNLSYAKSIGHGEFEYRINFGPGCRVYFGKNDDALIVLLGGETKKRQQSVWRKTSLAGISSAQTRPVRRPCH